MINFDLNLINNFVLQKQHLTNDSKIDDIIKITDDICGLHATGPMTPYLSLFARTRNFNKKDLEKELYINRNLGRIRCMRKTLFIHTKDMISLTYMATKNTFEKLSKKFLEFRGISLNEYEKISNSILKILRGKEMSTSEIKNILKIKSNISEIINLMCDRNILIRTKPVKSWKDRRNNYAIFNEYFPDIDLTKINENEARTQLIQKYIRSYAPVTRNDLVWWTGLKKTEVNKILNSINSQLEYVKISNLDQEFIIFLTDMESLKKNFHIEKQTVNLLPFLDPYLMGFKERERYLNFEYYNKVFDRSGNATSVILVNGRILGVWDIIEGKNPTVKLFFFEELNEKVIKKIYSEAQKIGRFITNEEVQIKKCNSMISLTDRTAGSFMSPLKDS